MSYEMRSDRLYMMPTHFGPQPGLRQTPAGGRYIDQPGIAVSRSSVPFLTRESQLQALCPPGFSVWGDPVLTIDFVQQTEIPWLAGRGYNIVNVRFPATYRGEQDEVSGQFMALLWENMADPILSGREQLGFSKIFADVEDPVETDGVASAGASWEGFEFLRFEQRRMRQLGDEEIMQFMDTPLGEGMLHYKYVPATGEPWQEADACYATLTPFDTEDGIGMELSEFHVGEGSLRFTRPRWEDMPTQHHIVEALCDLDILEYLPAYRMVFRDNNDLRGQRRLR